MGRKCIVPSCRYEKEGRSPKTVYSFPNSPELVEVWCKVIGVNSSTVKKCSVVCEEHFESKDFWPRYASGKLSLRPRAVPSRNLRIEVEDNNNLNVKKKNTISQTKLPDGSVCEFFSTIMRRAKTISSDGDSNDCNASRSNILDEVMAAGVSPEPTPIVLVEKAPRLDELNTTNHSSSSDCRSSLDKSKKCDTVPKNVGMDFDAISSALELGKVNLPSSCWSYSRLGRTVIMFLCWDKDLKLRKKAILHEDSQMSFYVGDVLLADGTTQDLSFELEGCLRVLDLFEHCKGLNSRNRIWSEQCTKYIFSPDGKQNCSACKKQEFSNDANLDGCGVGPNLKVVDAVRNCPFKIQPVSEYPEVILNSKGIVPEQRAPTSSSVTINAKDILFSSGVVPVQRASTAPSVAVNSKGVAASIIELPVQNVMAKCTDGSANSEFVVVDFVVSGGGVVPPNIQCSFTKPSKKLDVTPEQNKLKGLNQGFVKKATARKSTGGPRKHPTCIEQNTMLTKAVAFKIDHEAVITVEDEGTHCPPESNQFIHPVTNRIGADAGTQTQWASDDFVTLQELNMIMDPKCSESASSDLFESNLFINPVTKRTAANAGTQTHWSSNGSLTPSDQIKMEVVATEGGFKTTDSLEIHAQSLLALGIEVMKKEQPG